MKNIFCSLMIALLLNACTNSAGNIKSGGGKQSIAGTGNENVISFKANDKPVTSSGWNISRSIMMDMRGLNITSNMHEEPRTINININGDAPGTYKFMPLGGFKKDGYAYGSYFSDYKQDMMSPFNFGDGEFKIISIDTVRGLLNAVFFGTGVNKKGEKIIITDGKVVSGKLQPGVTRY